MSLLDLAHMIDEIEDAQEPTIAEKGAEAHLRIVSVRGGAAGEGNCEYFSPVFEIIDAPNMKEFSTFLWVPTKDRLSEKAFARSLYEIKVFAQAFKLDLSKPIDYEDDLPGLTGWAILGTKDSEEYGKQNTISKFITPK